MPPTTPTLCAMRAILCLLQIQLCSSSCHFLGHMFVISYNFYLFFLASSQKGTNNFEVSITDCDVLRSLHPGCDACTFGCSSKGGEHAAVCQLHCSQRTEEKRVFIIQRTEEKRVFIIHRTEEKRVFIIHQTEENRVFIIHRTEENGVFIIHRTGKQSVYHLQDRGKECLSFTIQRKM